jgi:hypothetical protein
MWNPWWYDDLLLLSDVPRCAKAVKVVGCGRLLNRLIDPTDMRSARDPRLIDLLTWAVGKGAKTFQQLTITDDARLVASTYVPHFDFACVVPASLTFSILDLAKASQLPNALKVGPRNYASPVAWLPGANWGTVALTIHATASALQRDTDLGRAAQLSLLAEYCAEDDAALSRTGTQGDTVTAVQGHYERRRGNAGY